MKLTWILTGFAALSGFAFPVSFNHAFASQDQLPPSIGKFRNTYYYSVQESDYAGQEKTETLLAMDESVLANVSAGFKKAISIEGSGKLLDGRVINFFGRKDGEARWHVTVHPYGRGVGDCPLIPFHSVAVDPTRIPLGSVVLIDETKGMRLADGSIHDGLWRAEDIGSAIQKDRVDLFVGEGDQGAILKAHGITNLMPLHVRMVSAPQADSCVNAEPRN